MRAIWPKVVVVGDSQVGKTCFIIVAQCGEYPSQYIPTVADCYSPGCSVPEKWISWWDTACSDPAYDRLRPLSYPLTDLFVVIFAVDNRESFFNIYRRWIPEIHYFSPGTPRMLIGTKSDMRQNLSRRPEEFVSQAEIDAMVRHFSFMTYREITCLLQPSEVLTQVAPCVYDQFALSRAKGFPPYSYTNQFSYEDRKWKKESKANLMPVIVPAFLPPSDIMKPHLLSSIDPMAFEVTDAQLKQCKELVEMYKLVFEVSAPAHLVLLSIRFEKGSSSLRQSTPSFSLLPIEVVRHILVLFDAVSRSSSHSDLFPSGEIILRVLAGQFPPLTNEFCARYNKKYLQLLQSQKKLPGSVPKDEIQQEEKKNCIVQ